jgi:hypothetical protein
VKKTAVLLFLITVSISPIEICAAQYCLDSRTDRTAEKRFKLLTGGMVIDQRRHLVWMRCSVGQLWDGEKNTCSGDAQPFTRFQTSQYLNQPSIRSHHWRLPSISELSSITELSCYNPAIDLKLFPNTPASHYWSATPFSNQAGHYWLVQFLTGENHTDTGKRLAFVRLVKMLPPSSIR